MHSQDTLARRPAKDFLNPSLFCTLYDTLPSNVNRHSEQWAEIARLAPNVKHFYIAANGTWGAMMNDGGVLTTCEVIGYHCCTSDLLAAILYSGRPVVVYRIGEPGQSITEHWLQ